MHFELASSAAVANGMRDRRRDSRTSATCSGWGTRRGSLMVTCEIQGGGALCQRIAYSQSRQQLSTSTSASGDWSIGAQCNAEANPRRCFEVNIAPIDGQNENNCSSRSRIRTDDLVRILTLPHFNEYQLLHTFCLPKSAGHNPKNFSRKVHNKNLDGLTPWVSFIGLIQNKPITAQRSRHRPSDEPAIAL